MKRFAVAVISTLLFLLVSFGAHGADATGTAVNSLAMLDIYSSSEGSMLNYFTLRPVIEYCNTEGNCKGILFDGVIFSGSKAFDDADGVMGYVDDLCVKGVFAGAEQTGNELYENSYLAEGEKYPLYAVFPYSKSFFDTDSEVYEFCRYYVDTLVFAFESKGYERISLAGLYFGSEFAADEDLRRFCIGLCREKGLAAVCSDKTMEGCDIVLGSTVTLKGVPSDSDKAFAAQLFTDAKEYVCGDDNTSVLFTFNAYNTPYECGAGLEENPPNKTARLTYEAIRATLRGDIASLEEMEAELGLAVNNGEDGVGRVPGKAEYAFYVFLSVTAAACFVYMLFALFRRKR